MDGNKDIGQKMSPILQWFFFNNGKIFDIFNFGEIFQSIMIDWSFKPWYQLKTSIAHYLCVWVQLLVFRYGTSKMVTWQQY